jgi:hypothetical protein
MSWVHRVQRTARRSKRREGIVNQHAITPARRVWTGSPGHGGTRCEALLRRRESPWARETLQSSECVGFEAVGYRTRLDGLPYCNGKPILPKYLLDSTGTCNNMQLDNNETGCFRFSRHGRAKSHRLGSESVLGKYCSAAYGQISLPVGHDSPERYFHRRRISSAGTQIQIGCKRGCVRGLAGRPGSPERSKACGHP